MQVIIPVINSGDKKQILSNGFHNTGTICIYNTDNGEYNWMDADDLKQHSGNLANQLHEQGIRMVVTNEISFMALTLFLDSGFEVYKADGNDLIHNIDMLNKQKLNLYGLHNAFKSSCSSTKCSKCSSTSCKN